ncbi:MAG: hypothetical protein QOE61_1354, partial [Micromonosporaceae bacterium]|nr:hypothetical protein [Micromonosporaceae bacterium]
MPRGLKRPDWLAATGVLQILKGPERLTVSGVLRRHRWPVLAASAVLLLLVGVVVAVKLPARVQTSGAITLKVQSARTVGDAAGIQEGDPITSYHWLITSDDVGNPHDSLDNCLPPRAGVASSADFADKCQWPSIRNTPGAVPIVAQGDQSNLAAALSLDGLPNGRYLISVTADGYKIDGAHFTVNGGATAVTVGMQPFPLPLGSIRIRVFNDSIPVDGTYEVDAEKGLAGFTAHLSDVMGEVSTDYYGNLLCTQYAHS